MIVETIIIKGGTKGTRIINRSDFDPAVHELADIVARGPLDHDGSGKKGGSLPRRRKAG